MQTGKKEGMQIMDQSLLELVKAGVVAGPTAWEYSNDKALFAQFAPRDLMVGTGQAQTGLSQVGTRPMPAPPRPAGSTGVGGLPNPLPKKTGT